jgi:DNA polymerase delta subunit 2
MIGGRHFVGTAGQPLENMFRFSRYEEAEPMSSGTSLEILEQTLLWQHMAPTAPDTLGCHPFKVMDPLILAQCPDVYFAGSQPDFATKVVEGPEGQKVGRKLKPRIYAQC